MSNERHAGSRESVRAHRRLRFGALPAPTFEIATGTKSAEETDMTILEALHLLGKEVIR